ncbi:type VI secretion system tube protein Hcp, partial [Salmonella enterica subsp. enterica]|nr:type VI secretion system tube protein Hcp [Salmonella enterica subsp. enterica]
MQVQGDCMMPGREGAIEIMNSSYGIKQAVDSHTGNMTGTRLHSPVTVHKQLD